MALAGRGGIVRIRARGIGNPDVAIAIHMQAMGKQHETRADGCHHLALRINLQDGVQIGIRAAVGTAAIDGPQVTAIGIDIDSRRRAPGPAIGQVDPVVDRGIGIGPVIDGFQLGLGAAGQQDG